MFLRLKARCHTRFQNAFTACRCVFKEVTLVGSNQRNYLENANSKRKSKTRVATWHSKETGKEGKKEEPYFNEVHFNKTKLGSYQINKDNHFILIS